MVKALYYKEWIKTRRAVLLAVVVMAAACAYTFINTAQEFRAAGAVSVWNGVITKDAPLLPAFVKWLPALAGLLFAFAQFTPEMTDKRLKLTLHLPVREGRIVSALLSYGTAVLASIFVAVYAALVAGFGAYYPREIVSAMCLQTLPWFLSGLCAYLLTAWVCLEPVWRQRILNGAAGAILASPLLLGAPSGGYGPMVPYMIVFTLVCFSFPFHSVARFKQGAQS